MVIDKTINNGINGYQIIDETGEYFIPAEIEQEAIDKYNEIKNTPVYTEPEYIKLRREAYPPLPEQFDMIWHLINNGTLGDTAKETKFFITIRDIKNKYPKE